ncbi:MAG: hypothetical protein Roseis2KO_25050 [Roseivirga sp.]
MDAKASNLDNVFSQLSNVENVDDLLKDEGLVPEDIVSDGTKRLLDIQAAHTSKSSVLKLIKDKMAKAVSKETKSAISSLKELVPTMNQQQVAMVFRSLSEPSQSEKDIEQIMQNLKSDAQLKEIMWKYNPRNTSEEG